jgi:hypothetical protein
MVICVCLRMASVGLKLNRVLRFIWKDTVVYCYTIRVQDNHKSSVAVFNMSQKIVLICV